MFFAQALAAAAEKDAWHEASYFLIKLPTGHYRREPAPFGGGGWGFLFDKYLQKLRHQRPERSKSQPRGFAPDRRGVQTQVINFKTQTLPIEITLIEYCPLSGFEISYFKDSSHRESFLTSERLSVKGSCLSSPLTLKKAITAPMK